MCKSGDVVMCKSVLQRQDSGALMNLRVNISLQIWVVRYCESIRARESCVYACNDRLQLNVATAHHTLCNHHWRFYFKVFRRDRG